MVASGTLRSPGRRPYPEYCAHRSQSAHPPRVPANHTFSPEDNPPADQPRTAPATWLEVKINEKLWPDPGGRSHAPMSFARGTPNPPDRDQGRSILVRSRRGSHPLSEPHLNNRSTSVGRISLPGYTNPHPFRKTDNSSRTFANLTLSKEDVYRDSASRRVRPHCASGPAVVFASPLPTQFHRFVLSNSVRLRRPRPKAGQHPIAHMRRITYKQNFLNK